MTLAKRLLAVKSALAASTAASLAFSAMAASWAHPEEYGLFYMTGIALIILHTLETAIISTGISCLTAGHECSTNAFRHLFSLTLPVLFSVAITLALLSTGMSPSGHIEILACAIVMGAVRPITNINYAILTARSLHGRYALISTVTSLLLPLALYVSYAATTDHTPILFSSSAAIAIIEGVLVNSVVSRLIGPSSATSPAGKLGEAIRFITKKRKDILKILAGSGSWALACNIDKIVLGYRMSPTAFGTISVGLTLFGFCMTIMSSSLQFQGDIHASSKADRKVSFDRLSHLSFGMLCGVVIPIFAMTDIALIAWSGKPMTEAAPVLASYLPATLPTAIAALLFTLQVASGQLVRTRRNSAYLTLITLAVGGAAWSWGPQASGLTFTTLMFLWLPLVGKSIYDNFWPGQFAAYLARIVIASFIPALTVSLAGAGLWTSLQLEHQRWQCLAYLAVTAALCLAMNLVVFKLVGHRFNLAHQEPN